jgi:hypothetical protein
MTSASAPERFRTVTVSATIGLRCRYLLRAKTVSQVVLTSMLTRGAAAIRQGWSLSAAGLAAGIELSFVHGKDRRRGSESPGVENALGG